MDRDSFYKPSGNVKNTNRTYVPDLYRQVASEMQAEVDGTQDSVDSEQHVITLQRRPIVGVLYSISAGIEGELFPVYVGRNTIGSDPSCDICLRETSVSALHAILLTRKQTDAAGREFVNVILSDSNSAYGTGVNNERLNFDRVQCTNGDIISIGQNYVLTLALFNAVDKLTVAYNFERMEEPVDDESQPAVSEPVVEQPVVISHQQNAPSGDEAPSATDFDFYKPTKKKDSNHYNNETIIL